MGCGFNHGGRGGSSCKREGGPGWTLFWWFAAIAFGICATLNILREQGISV